MFADYIFFAITRLKWPLFPRVLRTAFHEQIVCILTAKETFSLFHLQKLCIQRLRATPLT